MATTTPRRPWFSFSLRIPWSVGCGIACALLIVLWVRSYTTRDVAWCPGKKLAVEINSHSGHLALVVTTLEQRGGGFSPFKTSHLPIDGRPTLSFKDNVVGFLWRRQDNLTRIDIPFWFLMLIGIAIAAVPWLRETWRFSLRTLLIAVALFSAMLGLMAYAIRG